MKYRIYEIYKDITGCETAGRILAETESLEDAREWHIKHPEYDNCSINIKD